MDEMFEIDELHLLLVVSFVLMGPDPWLIPQILWLICAIGFYFTTPGYNGYDLTAPEGIGGKV